MKEGDINYESEIGKALSTPGYHKEFPMMNAYQAKRAFDNFVKTQKRLNKKVKFNKPCQNL